MSQVAVTWEEESAVPRFGTHGQHLYSDPRQAFLSLSASAQGKALAALHGWTHIRQYTWDLNCLLSIHLGLLQISTLSPFPHLLNSFPPFETRCPVARDNLQILILLPLPVEQEHRCGHLGQLSQCWALSPGVSACETNALQLSSMLGAIITSYFDNKNSSYTTPSPPKTPALKGEGPLETQFIKLRGSVGLE